MDEEARIALAVIYGLVALVSVMPHLPFVHAGDYYSLAILSEKCRLGDYTTTLVAGVEYRYCIYVANHSTEIRVLRVVIEASGEGEINVTPRRFTAILAPEQNTTLTLTVTPIDPGNYTIMARLYVLEENNWTPVNVTVNLTITSLAAP